MDQEGQLQRTVVLRKMTGKEEAIMADKRYQRNGATAVDLEPPWEGQCTLS
jgi:hypothetical protein